MAHAALPHLLPPHLPQIAMKQLAHAGHGSSTSGGPAGDVAALDEGGSPKHSRSAAEASPSMACEESLLAAADGAEDEATLQQDAGNADGESGPGSRESEDDGSGPVYVSAYEEDWAPRSVATETITRPSSPSVASVAPSAAAGLEELSQAGPSRIALGGGKRTFAAGSVEESVTD